MKFLKTTLILTVLSLFAFACSQNSSTSINVANNTAVVVNSSGNSNPQVSGSANDELASARKIYSEKCVKCHKEDGAGGVTDFDGTRIKAPNFTSDHQKKESDTDYIKTIENGAKEDGMPAYKGKISDDDIRNLVRLIRHDFQGQQ